MPTDRPPDAPPPRIAPVHWALLALIVAGGLGLRLYDIGRPAFTLDEYWNAELSTGRGTLHENLPVNRVFVPPPGTSLAGAPAWWRIPGSLGEVTHPPLYSIALRAWREAAGRFDGDAAMRAYSAVCGGLAVVPLFLAVCRLNGPRTALWAGLFYAVAATAILSSREVRPYGQLTLLATLLAWQLVRAEGRPASWGASVGMAVTALAMALTHYFALPLLAAMAVYAALRLDRSTLRRPVVAVAVAAALYAVAWGPSMLRQRGEVNESASVWMKDPAERPRAASLLRFADLPIRVLIPLRTSAYPAPYVAIGFVAAMAMLAWRGGRGDLLIWLTLFAGVGGFLLLLDLSQGTRMMHLIRYAMPAGPPMAALLAAVLCGLRGATGHAAPAALAAALLFSTHTAYEVDDYDFREFAAKLDRSVDRDRDVVLFAQERGMEWEAGFLHVVWSHYSSHGGAARCAIFAPPAPPALIDEMNAAQTVWLVGTVTAQPHALAALPGWRVAEHQSFLFIGDVMRLAPAAPEADTQPSVKP